MELLPPSSDIEVEEVADYLCNSSFPDMFLELDEHYIKSISHNLRTVLTAIRNTISSFIGRRAEFSISIFRPIISSITGDDAFRRQKTDKVRLFYEAAVVMMFCNHPSNDHVLYNMDELIEHYPNFITLAPEKQETLLQFRNVLRNTIVLVKARGNKEHILNLVTRIVEGSFKRYIPGSGQTADTTNRVEIYEREGDIEKLPRPPRRPGVVGGPQLTFDEEVKMERMRQQSNKRLRERADKMMNMRMGDHHSLSSSHHPHDPYYLGIEGQDHYDPYLDEQQEMDQRYYAQDMIYQKHAGDMMSFSSAPMILQRGPYNPGMYMMEETFAPFTSPSGVPLTLSLLPEEIGPHAVYEQNHQAPISLRAPAQNMSVANPGYATAYGYGPIDISNVKGGVIEICRG